MSEPLGDAEAGLLDRLATDPQLASLVGSDADGAVKVFPGWPTDALTNPQATQYPRIAVTTVLDSRIRRDVGRMRLQLDVFVWPDAENGGEEHRNLIDQRVLELLDEQWWVYRGLRISAIDLGARGFPITSRTPIRRMREFELLVSPA